jgi:hypothetical protein
VIIVFGVAVVPLLRLLASIGDFRRIVHHIVTVRDNWGQWLERTKHDFPQRISWTQISGALCGGSSPSYKIFASLRTKIIILMIVRGI